MTAPPPRWPLRKLIYQAARYEICLLLITNHACWHNEGGKAPTLAALKIAHVFSERQLATFVTTLRHAKLVTAWRDETNRRALILEPSPELIVEVGRHPSLMANAYARLRRQQTLPRTTKSSNWIAALLMRAAAAAVYLEGIFFPTIAAMAGHDSGFLILLAILRTYYKQTFALPVAAIPLTYAGLAARFQVSQTHVANLMRTGRAAGWFRVDRGGESFVVSAALISEFENFVSVQMCHFGLLAESLVSPAR